MVKRVMFILLAVLMTVPLIITASAEEEEETDFYEEYKAMLDALPSDVADLLPDKLYSDSPSDIANGAKELTSFGYVLKSIFSMIGLHFTDAVKLLATLMGILVLAAVLNAAKSSFASPGAGDAFSLCSAAAVFLTATTAQYAIVRSVSDFFTRICAFANAMIPLMGALYAMGGNVGSAVVSHSSLMLFMSIVENFCAKSVIPVAGVCMAFAAASAVSPDINIGGMSGAFKKLYTNTLTFIMTVFGTVMAAQDLLSSKADTLAGKTVKFAMGNLIPVVGGALSGSLGTLSMGVEYIRSSVGVVGIFAVAFMLLPTLITLLMTKYALSLASGAADILGCPREGRIISELAGINGFLMAAACICSAVFIFMLTMFAKCSAAIGGNSL